MAGQGALGVGGRRAAGVPDQEVTGKIRSRVLLTLDSYKPSYCETIVTRQGAASAIAVSMSKNADLGVSD